MLVHVPHLMFVSHPSPLLFHGYSQNLTVLLLCHSYLILHYDAVLTCCQDANVCMVDSLSFLICQKIMTWLAINTLDSSITDVSSSYVLVSLVYRLINWRLVRLKATFRESHSLSFLVSLLKKGLENS